MNVKYLKKIIFVLLVLHSYVAIAQNEDVNQISEFDTWNNGMTFTIQAGVWIPMGDLKKTFTSSPNLGFRFGFPVSQTLRIDLGASINMPLDSKHFEYNDHGNRFTAKSENTINGILGVWLAQETRFNNHFIFSRYVGLGVGFIQTDTKKFDTEDGTDEWFGVETMNINLGISISRIVMKKNAIGIFVEYNYAPYALFNKVDKGFGNRYVITGLQFRF